MTEGWQADDAPLVNTAPGTLPCPPLSSKHLKPLQGIGFYIDFELRLTSEPVCISLVWLVTDGDWPKVVYATPSPSVLA